MPWYISTLVIVVASQVFILLEHRFPYDKGQKLFRKGWFNDFFLYSIVQSFALGYVITGMVMGIDKVYHLTSHPLLGQWPLWAQVLFFLFTHDLYIYWFHRAQHRFPVLWRIHEAHHSVENVDWLAGSRSHAFEILINQTIEFAPIYLLTGSPNLWAIKAMIDAVWGMYIHSNINVKSGPLQYVINGPEMHRWHHSREYVGYGFNYGTKFAFWDYLFGTAHRPAYKPPGYGLDEPFPQSYLGQFAFAFRPFSKSGGDVEAPASEPAVETIAPSASLEGRSAVSAASLAGGGRALPAGGEASETA